MIRHRIVARGVTGEGWTVALVRYLTDTEARSLMDLHKAKSMYKDALTVAVFRETFGFDGMTTERVEI